MKVRCINVKGRPSGTVLVVGKIHCFINTILYQPRLETDLCDGKPMQYFSYNTHFTKYTQCRMIPTSHVYSHNLQTHMPNKVLSLPHRPESSKHQRASCVADGAESVHCAYV